MSSSSSRATSIDRNPSRATSSMIARLRRPRSVAESQLSITAATSAALTITGIDASRQPPTGGTAAPSRNGSNWRR